VYTPNNERLRSNDEYRHCIEHEQLGSTSIDGGDQSGGRGGFIESTPALWPVQMSNTKGRIHLNMTNGDPRKTFSLDTGAPFTFLWVEELEVCEVEASF
jgi:hypothetical protein